MRDQRIVVHGLHDVGIAREHLVLEMQDVGVREDVAHPLEHGQREIRRGDLVSKALADEPVDLGLVLQRVNAGDDAARAVAEQKDRKPGLARFRQRHERRGVAHVIGERVDVEPLTIRPAAPAQVDGVRRHTGRHELFGGRLVVTAV